MRPSEMQKMDDIVSTFILVCPRTMDDLYQAGTHFILVADFRTAKEDLVVAVSFAEMGFDDVVTQMNLPFSAETASSWAASARAGKNVTGLLLAQVDDGVLGIFLSIGVDLIGDKRAIAWELVGGPARRAEMPTKRAELN